MGFEEIIIESLNTQLDTLITISYLMFTASFLFLFQSIRFKVDKKTDNNEAAFFGMTISKSSFDLLYLIVALFLVIYQLRIYNNLHDIIALSSSIISTKLEPFNVAHIEYIIIHHPAPLNLFYFNEKARISNFDYYYILSNIIIYALMYLPIFVTLITSVVRSIWETDKEKWYYVIGKFCLAVFYFFLILTTTQAADENKKLLGLEPSAQSLSDKRLIESTTFQELIAKQDSISDSIRRAEFALRKKRYMDTLKTNRNLKMKSTMRRINPVLMKEFDKWKIKAYKMISSNLFYATVFLGALISLFQILVSFQRKTEKIRYYLVKNTLYTLVYVDKSKGDTFWSGDEYDFVDEATDAIVELIGNIKVRSEKRRHIAELEIEKQYNIYKTNYKARE